jgi:hypothetical protein
MSADFVGAALILAGGSRRTMQGDAPGHPSEDRAGDARGTRAGPRLARRPASPAPGLRFGGPRSWDARVPLTWIDGGSDGYFVEQLAAMNRAVLIVPRIRGSIRTACRLGFGCSFRVAGWRFVL